MKIKQHNAGHMTKMSAMPIHVYGKNTLKIFFLGTTGPILMKPCFIFCSYYDPGLTMTYFMAMSNFAT